MLFSGLGVAIATPFTPDNKIDYYAYEKMLDMHLKTGTKALIVAGTTGEGATLTVNEKKDLFKFTKCIVGDKIKVVACTGSNNTTTSLKLSREAERIGVDGLLIITPYYNKGSKSGLINHFLTIAEGVNIPILIYNVPSRTNVDLSPSDIFILSGHNNIIGLKESSYNMDKIIEEMRILPKDFSVYSGNDDMTFSIMALGGKGVVSVCGNIIPDKMKELISHIEGYEYDKARNLQLYLKPLMDALFLETNPSPIKWAMHIMGMVQNELRLPMEKPIAENRQKIKDILHKYKII